RLGISKCLLGEKVRYDGEGKRDHFLTDSLGQFVEYVPVCPEVEYGLPVPREAMRLVGNPDAPRLMTVHTKTDHTDGMLSWASKRVLELEKEDLCGFIFKSRSPSSGMERVKVYDEKGIPQYKGVGMFARAFMEHFPLLPVEDEGRLNDPGLRENFIERIFALKRWRDLLSCGKNIGAVVEFHTRHKLLLLSHSPEKYRVMGKLVAHAKEVPLDEFYARYITLFMDSLKLKATLPKHINVLQHTMGYFKQQLSADEKQELLDILGLYRQGHVPLIVPVTLINHYVRKYDQRYLSEQYYLHPHPIELRLRNHA
ncbi:MAG: YbgA family protein, partial [Syntrophobacteraceae bacterium]